MISFKNDISLVKINSQWLEYENPFKPRFCFESVKEEDARRLFHETKKLFDEAGIKFSLIYGTLLGAVRTGSFIPHDTDLDIYVWDEEKLRENIIPFYEKGLKLCRIEPGRLYSFWIDNTCYIDVYIFRELKGIRRLLWGFSCISLCGYETPRKFFTGYQEINFLGEKCLCPENPERLLEFLYGSDWRIPQKKGGNYRVKSSQIIHNARDTFRKVWRFLFDGNYRLTKLFRKEKTGSFFARKE